MPKNDTPRDWECVPLVMEVFGDWGNEAQEALSRVAKKLATRTSHFWPEVFTSIYWLPPGHYYADVPEC